MEDHALTLYPKKLTQRLSLMSQTLKAIRARATCCRRKPRFGTASKPPRETYSPATTSARFAHLSSRTRRFLLAAWARRPTSSRKKCTPGRSRPRAVGKDTDAHPPPGEHRGVVRAYIEHGLARADNCRSSTTLARSFARASAEGPLRSSRRSARRSSGRRRRAAKARSAMLKFSKCWPRCSTSWHFRLDTGVELRRLFR